MKRDDAINPQVDQYCTNCYEVVPMGEISSHREEEHNGRMDIDLVPIHIEGDGYIAQDSSMGHFSPHQFIDVDDHQMCGECGAVKIKTEDIPKELVEERGAEA